MTKTIKQTGNVVAVANNKEEVNMNNQTVKELKVVAKELGVKGAYKLRKKELISAIEQASTPVAKEVKTISNREEASFYSKTLLAFLKVSKGQPLSMLASIITRFNSVRKLQLKDSKGRRFIFVQLNPFYGLGKINFVVIEKDGVLLSSRIATSQDFSEAEKNLCLLRSGKAANPELCKKLAYRSFVGFAAVAKKRPSGTLQTSSRRKLERPSNEKPKSATGKSTRTAPVVKKAKVSSIEGRLLDSSQGGDSPSGKVAVVASVGVSSFF